MKKAASLFAAIALSACATVPSGPRYYPPQTVTFDPSSVAWAMREGENTLSGNAVIRTVGGEARTCAGSPSGVIPVSDYSSERMRMVFGSVDHGYTPADQLMQFQSAPPGYSEANHMVTCDAQGNFEVPHLPDGDYFVLSTVVWGVPQGNAYFSYTATQGGALMQRVHLRGGERRRVVLTN